MAHPLLVALALRLLWDLLAPWVRARAAREPGRADELARWRVILATPEAIPW